jgi:hypothetical protein
MRGASGIDMGTTIKHLRRTTSAAAGNGLGATHNECRREQWPEHHDHPHL